jgi:protein TonB
LAGALTLAVFLVLPLADLFSVRPTPMLRLVPADTVRLRPPPPIRPPDREPEHDVTRPTPRPALAPTDARPARPQPNLAMALPAVGVGGDFALDFRLEPVGLVHAEALVFDVADLDQPPQPLARLRPLYPARARLRRIEGSVTLEFLVDPQGRTSDVTVMDSEPGDTFVGSAVRAVLRWRFKPGMRDGKPVMVRVRQKVIFKLEDTP